MVCYIISGWAIGKIGVKRTQLIFFTLSTVGGALILTSTQESDFVFALFVLIAKFGISGAFNGVYIGNVELFPTLFAVTAMGIVNLVARVSAIFAPLAAEAKQPLPMLLFTIFSVISTIAAIFLVETRHK